MTAPGSAGSTPPVESRAVLAAARHPVHSFTRRRHPIAEHRADSRISAYVYGDVLVLAATVGVSADAVRSGNALLIVLGTVLSTYVAHVLADCVGAVFSGHDLRAVLRDETRDSVPIVSAGLPSFVLLGAAALGWPSALWAQSLASAVLVARLAALGLVYRRLHHDVGLARALWGGIGVAAVAAVVVALKVGLTH